MKAENITDKESEEVGDQVIENKKEETDKTEASENEQEVTVNIASEVTEEKIAEVDGVEFKFVAGEYELPENAEFIVASRDAAQLADSDVLKEKLDEVIKTNNENERLESITGIKAFDFSLLLDDEAISSFDGQTIAVRLSTEVIDSNSNFKIFYISDDASKIEEIDYEKKEDGIYLYTTHFSTYAIVSYETATDENPVNEYDLVDSVKFLLNGNEVTSDSTISLSDKFKIKYLLKSPLSLNYSEEFQDDAGKIYISQGNTYKLPSLSDSSFDLESIETFSVYVNDNGKEVEFGQVTVGSGGSVDLNVTYESNKEVYDVYIEIEFGLNADLIGSNTKYEFTIPTANGTTTVMPLINENQPKTPTITKKAGNLDENDDITWTVTIKNDSNPIEYTNGYIFKDSFSSNQSYVTDSFKVNSSAATPSVSDGTITYNFTDNGADATTCITYKTHVDFLSSGSTQNGTISLDVENNAELYDADDTSSPIVSKAVTETVSKELANWVQKEGGILNSDGVASWTITVNTNGYNLKKLTVYDVFSTDSSTTMTLDEKSVVVVDTVTNTTLTSDDYEINTSASTSENGKSYNWYLRFKGTETDGNYDYKLSGNHIYTITYKTKIEDYISFLQTNHTVIPGNIAFLEYEYDYTGNGEYKLLSGPTLDKVAVSGAGVVTKAAIEKSCSTYDASTHKITWKIVVNKNYQELTSSKVTELIGDGQEFDSISDVTLTDSNETTSLLNLTQKSSTDILSEGEYFINSDGNVEVYFGDKLKGVSASFTVVTILKDDQSGVWSENNDGTTYKNTVQLDSDQQTNVTDTASCTYKSTVIEKIASAFNYDTHEIEYTITVNRNKMAMKEVIVTDDIGSLGLSLVDGSVTLAKGSAEAITLYADSSNEPYYEYSDGVIKFYLDDITDVGSESATETITFSAKVDDGEIFTSTNGGVVSVTNTAALTTSDTVSEVQVSATTKWTNKIIEKIASVDEETKKISYTVYFNGNKQILPSNLIIRDTLGADLSLDEASVKLYTGQIDGSNGTITSTENEETGYSVEISPDGEKTRLDVYLPERTENKNIYVLTYTAMPVDITSGGDYTNAVQLVGYTNSDTNNASTDLSYTAFGGGWIVTPQYLIVTVVDKDDNDIKISGAKFDVLNESGETVASITSKANGKATLVGKLAAGSDYTLKMQEESIPEYYEYNDEEVSFSTNTSGGIDNATTVTFELEKMSEEVSIQKVDSYNEVLTGVNLSISRILTDGSTVTDKFTTESLAYSFDASYGVVYTLSEAIEDVPFGYDKADDILFKIGDDGKLNIYDKATDKYVTFDNYEIQMVDRNLDTYSFTVDIVDEDGTSLSGGEISVTNLADSSLIGTYITSGKAVRISLPSGTYSVRQSEIPYGYLASSDQELIIRIDDNGNIYTLKNTEDEVGEKSESKEFQFIDIVDDTIQAEIEFKEVDDLGNPLENVEITLYRLENNENSADVVTSWISDGTSNILLLNYQKVYVLKEVLKDFDGNETAISVKLTVIPIVNGDVVQNVLMSISEDGSTTELEELTISVKLPEIPKETENIPSAEPEPENIQEEIKPTSDTEPKSENNQEENAVVIPVAKNEDSTQPKTDIDNNQETVSEKEEVDDAAAGNSSEENNKDITENNTSDEVTDSQSSTNPDEWNDDSDEYRTEETDSDNDTDTGSSSNSVLENILNALSGELSADEMDLPDVQGAYLAKTGGFIGTVFAYIFGFILIIFGCLVLFRKKKVNEK